jgi:hypothetical protein
MDVRVDACDSKLEIVLDSYDGMARLIAFFVIVGGSALWVTLGPQTQNLRVCLFAAAGFLGAGAIFFVAVMLAKEHIVISADWVVRYHSNRFFSVGRRQMPLGEVCDIRGKGNAEIASGAQVITCGRVLNWGEVAWLKDLLLREVVKRQVQEAKKTGGVA